MPMMPAPTMNKTKIALAMPQDTSHRSCTRPGPVKSGVDRIVRPTRSSTGLRASSTRPLNQSLIALRTRPPMSKNPGWSSPPALGRSAPAGAVVVGVANGSAGAVVEVVGETAVAGGGWVATVVGDGGDGPGSAEAGGPATPA